MIVIRSNSAFEDMQDYDFFQPPFNKTNLVGGQLFYMNGLLNPIDPANNQSPILIGSPSKIDGSPLYDFTYQKTPRQYIDTGIKYNGEITIFLIIDQTEALGEAVVMGSYRAISAAGVNIAIATVSGNLAYRMSTNIKNNSDGSNNVKFWSIGGQDVAPKKPVVLCISLSVTSQILKSYNLTDGLTATVNTKNETFKFQAIGTDNIILNDTGVHSGWGSTTGPIKHGGYLIFDKQLTDAEINQVYKYIKDSCKVFYPNFVL